MTLNQIQSLYGSPLAGLVERAHAIHRQNFREGKIQASSLLSIKTGGCPEDCAYCAQSSRYQTGLKKERLLGLPAVLQKAREAKAAGASRFCMGAAGREVKDGTAFEKTLEMVRAVKGLGLEVCCALGMLALKQARQLKEAGLDAYNHNLDTSPEFYSKIISTRKYEDRLRTLRHVRAAGLAVCTGGILGMGETDQDRVSLIHQLQSFSPPPESLTINCLIPIPGTPLEGRKPVSALDVARFAAVCRILMPRSFVRLSAGRAKMSAGEQFLCFYSGANSIFLGDRLLTAENPALSADRALLKSAGLKLSAPAAMRRAGPPAPNP